MASVRILKPLAVASRSAAAAPLRSGAAVRALHATAFRRKVEEIKRQVAVPVLLRGPWRERRSALTRAEEFQQAISSNPRVIVDCFADWCGPCKVIAPILSRHSEEAEFKGKVHFVKMDVDALPQVTQQLGVRAMPTFVLFRDGEKVGEIVGANPPALVQGLRKLLA
ncbi:hypothetical protein HIM_00696 [Hirsutella minnesotensis 3608]|nr:hypothetical protein HIM_00696 [Hirsutella minnesotensis 3608]